MANLEHIKIISNGVEAWNNWRKANPEIVPDFSGAALSHTNFDNANLKYANFSGADLSSTSFKGADLSYANFFGAKIKYATFTDAYLVETNFEAARLSDVSIPNVKSWSPKINEKTSAIGIEVNPKDEASISVDDFEFGYFISILLNAERLRNLINLATAKVVLILGRFSEERKQILDAIRDKLRFRGYIAIIFDFDGPIRRDITETISLLAHLSRFVVADITDAKSIPQELQAIVPNLPSVIFQPILQSNIKEYSMFEHFKSYPWVLPIFYYENETHLISSLEDQIITPAINKSDIIVKNRNTIN